MQCATVVVVVVVIIQSKNVKRVGVLRKEAVKKALVLFYSARHYCNVFRKSFPVVWDIIKNKDVKCDERLGRDDGKPGPPNLYTCQFLQCGLRKK